MRLFLLIITGFITISFCNVYPQAVEEDILYFKDGNIKRGVITGISSDGNVTMRTDLGTLRAYSLTQIDSIVKSNRKALEEGVRMAESQTLRGVFSIGGAVQYSSAKTRGLFKSSNTGIYQLVEYDYSHLVISPSLGYFMFDNFSLNFAIDYERYENDYESEDRAAYVIYMTYYFGPSASKPFISAGYLILSEHAKEANSGFFIGGGYNIAVSKNVSLQPMARYTSYFPEDKKEGELDSIAFGIGVRTFIF